MKERETAPKRFGDEADVTASEVAAYTYCAKAWHLERVLGKPADRFAASRRAEGVNLHLAHGSRVSRLGHLGRNTARASAVLLIVAAFLLVIATLL